MDFEKYILNTLNNFDEKSDMLFILFTEYFKYKNNCNHLIKFEIDIDYIIQYLKNTKKYSFTKYYDIKKYIHELGKMNLINIHQSICIDGKFMYSIDSNIMDAFKICMCLTLVN
jgi:hypothetical protein